MYSISRHSAGTAKQQLTLRLLVERAWYDRQEQALHHTSNWYFADVRIDNGAIARRDWLRTRVLRHRDDARSYAVVERLGADGWHELARIPQEHMASAAMIDGRALVARRVAPYQGEPPLTHDDATARELAALRYDCDALVEEAQLVLSYVDYAVFERDEPNRHDYDFEAEPGRAVAEHRVVADGVAP